MATCSNCCSTTCTCTAATCDDGTCPNSYCHDAFVDLPKILRMRLVGADDRCLTEFPPGARGFVVFDGKGGAVVSTDPDFDLQEMVTYVRDKITGDVVFEDGVPVRTTPEVDYLVTEDEDGKLKKFRGPQTGTGFVYWDGSKYVFGSMRDEGLCTTAAIPTSGEVKLAGWATDACDPCGDDEKCINRWVPLAEGIVQVDSDGNASTLSLCAFDEEDLVEQKDAYSILGCDGSGGDLVGVKPFSLATPTDCSVLVHDGETDSEWVAAPLDDPAPMGFVMPITPALSVYQAGDSYTSNAQNLLSPPQGVSVSNLPSTETVSLSPPDGAVGVLLKTFLFANVLKGSGNLTVWAKANGVPLAVAVSGFEQLSAEWWQTGTDTAETTLPLTGDSVSVTFDYDKSGQDSGATNLYRTEIWVTGWIINPCAALPA